MYRCIFTYRFQDGTCQSELSNYKYEIGDNYTAKNKDGQWEETIIVARYDFDLEGKILPL